jgi:UDP-glucose 4-epimerase
VHKLAIEDYLQLYHHQHGINAFSLRVANAYGPGQLKGAVIGAVAAFLKRIVAGEPIEIWGDGEIVRDYVWIDDIVAAFTHMALHGNEHPSGSYNVGSGTGHSLNQVIQKISEVTGCPAEVRHLPPRGFDVPHIVLDSGKLTNETGWQPQINLEAGIRKLLAVHENSLSP